MGWPHIARLTQRVGLAGCTTRTASTNGIPPPDLPLKGTPVEHLWPGRRAGHLYPCAMPAGLEHHHLCRLVAMRDTRYATHWTCCHTSALARTPPETHPHPNRWALILSPAYAGHRLHQTHRSQMATRRVDVPSWRVFVT